MTAFWKAPDERASEGAQNDSGNFVKDRPLVALNGGVDLDRPGVDAAAD
jgi:hypothetical protein